MRTRGLATLAAVLLGAFGASSTSSVRADDATSLASPPLAMSLTPGTARGPWKLRVENTGDVPVRIAADSRLLVLDVTPPAGFVDPAAKTKRAASAKPDQPKPVRCMLPEDARPATDEGRDLVVPAKRSWSATIDPLLYCFPARERAMLVAGATITAHLGWPAPLPRPGARTKPTVLAPPFVTAPVGAAVGKVAPAKELVSAPVTLGESVSGATPPAAAGGPPSQPLPPGSVSLVVSMPDSLDVARGSEISTTVTVANVGDKAAVLLFQSDMLRFDVAGPAGSVACGATRAVDAPIRELYSTIGAKAHASLSVLLTAVCPADTFDEPGVYRITATLDTSAASGRPIGLESWDGEAQAHAPMLLRVRAPRRPEASTTRPALD